MFSARVTLYPAESIGSVDRRLFGANLEHFGETIYGGIWTEMIRSRKFSGPDPRFYEMAGDHGRNPNHGVVVPWEAVNPDQKHVIYEHDRTNFYVGAQSQRITVRLDDYQPHGIKQRGLFLEANREYSLRLVMRGEGQPVAVRLGQVHWDIPSVGGSWETFNANLIVPAYQTDGSLAITFQGEYSLWVGAVSLMPVDEDGGFRDDLIRAMEPWSPTHLRWPGGNFASAYHWKDGIGDPDQRAPYLDPAFKLWESNDVGTDEFIEFCGRIGAEPMITVNMGDGTPEEAAGWVEYCNGSPETKFGALRAQNGHPEPYGLKTWYVGNEQFGNWQVGHCDPETYAHRFLAFAHAMRAVDQDLTLIAVGVPADFYGHWNERLIQIAGSEIDLLSLHYYSIRTWRLDPSPPPEDLILPKLAAGYEVKKILEATLDGTAPLSDPPVPIAFDEWNTNTRGKPPLWIEDYNIADALYTAAVMHACLEHCDRVPLSAIYNLVNAMGSYRVTPESVWKVPATLVMELLSQYHGEVAICCEVESPTFGVEETWQQRGYEAVPYIDAAAMLSPKENKLILSIINRSTEAAAQVALDGILPTGPASFYWVKAEHALTENTGENPEAVKVETEEAFLNTPELPLPPLSYLLAVIPIED